MAPKRILSFKFAIEGFISAFKEEPNLKIHLVVSALVIAAGLILGIELSDWLALIICIGVVISVELTNTAIEEVTDSFTDKSHPGAKRAKDVSAAAVLVVSLMALFVGIVIFLPYLQAIFR